MFENLTLVAITVIVVWVLTLAYYFHISRQQKTIRKELESLRQTLDRKEQQDS